MSVLVYSYEKSADPKCNGRVIFYCDSSNVVPLRFWSGTLNWATRFVDRKSAMEHMVSYGHQYGVDYFIMEEEELVVFTVMRS